MKILFSPSESKQRGGKQRLFCENNTLFPDTCDARLSAFHAYCAYLSHATQTQLEHLFGTKETKQCDEILASQNILMKAVSRYEGVGYTYLAYERLSEKSKRYLDENLIIFSNLLGPVRAGDYIPLYKLKQGEGFSQFSTEKFYRDYFASPLDSLLSNEDILDLRAGFYEKCYKPHVPYYTMKFLKSGKVVSHWAKAYRGIVAHEVATREICCIDELMEITFEGLRVCELLKKGSKTELVFEIYD